MAATAAAGAAARRILVVYLAVVVAAFLGAAPRGADALRSLGVEGAGGAGAAHGDAAVDLDAGNFTDFLQASPESFAVVEFFAHWSAPLASDSIDSFISSFAPDD
jgi:thiol oxidase